MEMDPEAALELKKRSSLLREHGIGKSLIWRQSSLMYVTMRKFINIVCNTFYIILYQSSFLTTPYLIMILTEIAISFLYLSKQL